MITFYNENSADMNKAMVFQTLAVDLFSKRNEKETDTMIFGPFIALNFIKSKDSN